MNTRLLPFQIGSFLLIAFLVIAGYYSLFHRREVVTKMSHSKIDLSPVSMSRAAINQLVDWRHILSESHKKPDILKGVRYIDLTSTGVADSELIDIARFNSLIGLSLGSTAITDKSLVTIGQLTTLSKLDVSGTRITDEGLRHLSQLRDLRELDLSGTLVTDGGVKHLAGLTQLRYFNVDDTAVTNECYWTIIDRCPATKADLEIKCVASIVGGLFVIDCHLFQLCFAGASASVADCAIFSVIPLRKSGAFSCGSPRTMIAADRYGVTIKVDGIEARIVDGGTSILAHGSSFSISVSKRSMLISSNEVSECKPIKVQRDLKQRRPAIYNYQSVEIR